MFDHSFSFDCQDKVILVVEDDYDIGDIIENYLCTRQISQNPYPIRILPS